MQIQIMYHKSLQANTIWKELCFWTTEITFQTHLVPDYAFSYVRQRELSVASIAVNQPGPSKSLQFSNYLPGVLERILFQTWMMSDDFSALILLLLGSNLDMNGMFRMYKLQPPKKQFVLQGTIFVGQLVPHYVEL